MTRFSALRTASLAGLLGLAACSASISTKEAESPAPAPLPSSTDPEPGKEAAHGDGTWNETCADRSDARFRHALRRDLDGDGLRDWVVMREQTLELFVVRDACLEARGTIALDGAVANVIAVGEPSKGGLRDLIVDTYAGLPSNVGNYDPRWSKDPRWSTDPRWAGKAPYWRWWGRRYAPKNRTRYLWTWADGYVGVSLEDDIPHRTHRRARYQPVPVETITEP